ncbi:MAG: hypothetical protein U5L96_09860 [Owenweeksia sp.]|nr:hypothetical protein [Owenweeksia sp.]
MINVVIAPEATAGLTANATCADCNGDINGTAFYDGCGQCAGGNTGITPNSGCTTDCYGDINGTARWMHVAFVPG